MEIGYDMVIFRDREDTMEYATAIAISYTKPAKMTISSSIPIIIN
jgi:hypothetical protein